MFYLGHKAYVIRSEEIYKALKIRVGIMKRIGQYLELRTWEYLTLDKDKVRLLFQKNIYSDCEMENVPYRLQYCSFKKTNKSGLNRKKLYLKKLNYFKMTGDWGCVEEEPLQ